MTTQTWPWERLLTEVQHAVSIRNDAGDAAIHYVDTVGWLLTPVLEQYL